MIIVAKLHNKNSEPNNKDLYIEKYGQHFNKKLCEFALSIMQHSDKPNNLTWEKVMSMLERYNIKLDINYPYDIYYVANMGYHDYYKSSIVDEEHLALFIKDYIEDEDGYVGAAFCRWLEDLSHKKIEIDWGNMI